MGIYTDIYSLIIFSYPEGPKIAKSLSEHTSVYTLYLEGSLEIHLLINSFNIQNH